MKTAIPENFDASKHLEKTQQQFQKRFGVIAGYLPKDIKHIGKWLSDYR